MRESHPSHSLSDSTGGSPRAMRRMHSEEIAGVEPGENSTGLRCDRSRENACAAPPLRQPGAPGRLQDSFLCAPQQTCAHLQHEQTAWAHTSSPGSPRPRPEPLLPSPQRPDCSPWLARGEALRVPAVTPAGTPSRGHTQPLGWSSGCRAPRISPDFKPLPLCL